MIFTTRKVGPIVFWSTANGFISGTVSQLGGSLMAGSILMLGSCSDGWKTVGYMIEKTAPVSSVLMRLEDLRDPRERQDQHVVRVVPDQLAVFVKHLRQNQQEALVGPLLKASITLSNEEKSRHLSEGGYEGQVRLQKLFSDLRSSVRKNRAASLR